MKNASLKPVIEELESLFSTFNKAFFEGKLEKPVITVSPDSTKGAYGWCTGWKAWQNGTENGGFYEINLCAEYLNRPFERFGPIRCVRDTDGPNMKNTGFGTRISSAPQCWTCGVLPP